MDRSPGARDLRKTTPACFRTQSPFPSQVRRYFRQIYRMLKGGGEDLTGVREALLRTLEASHNGARAQALRAANSITLLGDVLEGAEEHAALQATLQAIQKRHTHRSAVWALLASWRREQRLWLTAPVTGLDVRSVSDGVGAHYQRAFELQMMMQDEMTHDEPLVRLLLASIRDGKAYLPILMQVWHQPPKHGARSKRAPTPNAVKNKANRTLILPPNTPRPPHRCWTSKAGNAYGAPSRSARKGESRRAHKCPPSANPRPPHLTVL